MTTPYRTRKDVIHTLLTAVGQMVLDAEEQMPESWGELELRWFIARIAQHALPPPDQYPEEWIKFCEFMEKKYGKIESR